MLDNPFKFSVDKPAPATRALKILVVDDEPISRDLLQNALEQSGYEVRTAANGCEAMRILPTSGCRAVISDWEMPEMDGIQLVRSIRQCNYDGYVYCILLTCRGGKQDLIQAIAAGADEFMTKPFDPAELSVRIRTAERIINQETQDLTIFSLAKLAESRDPETGAHLERVQHYCRILAQHLSANPAYQHEVTPEFVRLIYQTSPLHDIGKVGIPDSVLLKPGRLSDREFQIMKSHTVIGAETLDAVLKLRPGAAFLRVARDVAACHHERWDGTGYPNRLKGRAIPLCARILALADVYDALTSKRVYKAAMTHEVARAAILEGKGTHFDPDLVDAFVEVENQFLAVRDAFGEAEQPERLVA